MMNAIEGATEQIPSSTSAAELRLVPLILVLLTAPLVAGASAPDASQHDSHAADIPSAIVEQVRRATQDFQDPEAAKSAGYEPFLGCVSGSQEGAMGVHYVNSELVGDGELDVDHPEAVIYESRNGSPRLIGAEYIVMVDAWHERHKEPPVLQGQLLQYNGSPNRYGLPPFYEIHVWAWRNNPNGTFVDWNPRVSCEGR